MHTHYTLQANKKADGNDDLRGIASHLSLEPLSFLFDLAKFMSGSLLRARNWIKLGGSGFSFPRYLRWNSRVSSARARACLQMYKGLLPRRNIVSLSAELACASFCICRALWFFIWSRGPPKAISGFEFACSSFEQSNGRLSIVRIKMNYIRSRHDIQNYALCMYTTNVILTDYNETTILNFLY